MIEFTCQRGQLKIYACEWPPERKHRRWWATVTADGRYPLVFIHRGVKTNAEYYQEKYCPGQYCNPGQTNISAADQRHSNRTQYHRTQHSSTKNGLKKRFSVSFLPQNGYQNLRISIRWTFAPVAFWRIRFSLKNTKTALRQEWAKIVQSHFRAACDDFVGRLETIIRSKGGQFEQI